MRLALLRCAAGAIVLVHLWPSSPTPARPDLPGCLLPAMRVVVPGASRRSTVACWRGRGAAVAMSLGLRTRSRRRHVEVVSYNLFRRRPSRQPVLPGDRAGSTGGRALWKRVVGRRLLAPGGLPALDPRSPAWPLWLLRFEAAWSTAPRGWASWSTATGSGHGHVASDGPGARPARRIAAAGLVSLLVDRSVHTVAAR
jgi:hypothetical protein